MAAMASSESDIGCCRSMPRSEAGHGGMYRVLVDRARPSATSAASRAVASSHSPAPEPFGWWHDAHESSRIGCTVSAKDGPPLA